MSASLITSLSSDEMWPLISALLTQKGEGRANVSTPLEPTSPWGNGETHELLERSDDAVLHLARQHRVSLSLNPRVLAHPRENFRDSDRV